MSIRSCIFKSNRTGFTLIELLVALSIVALLLSIVTPRYFHNVDKAKENVLKSNLAIMRSAIDKYYGDNERYPETLQDLVTRKYLRSIPKDPVTDSATTWIIIAPEDKHKGAVYDIKSGAQGTTRAGVPYDKL